MNARAFIEASACARWIGPLLALAACRTEQTLVTPDPHLERMLRQEKVMAYGESPALPHGMAMQKPPDGTVTFSTDEAVGTPLASRGRDGDVFASAIPVRVDRALVQGGQQHFDTFCATCHGVLGDGVSAVASKMELRKPPSLLTPDVRGYAPGRLYATIREGYGLMPSYATELSAAESWGVVAYVRALMLSRGVLAAELPADVRAELAKAAP